MTSRNERIKMDTIDLKRNGFRNIKNHFSYNYFDNWEKAVMIYICEKDNELFFKYSMPHDFNIDILYDQLVKPKINGEIIRKDMEYQSRGAVFNIVFKKDNVVKTAMAKVDPDFKLHYREVDLYGKTKNLDS